MGLKHGELLLSEKLKQYAESDFYPYHMPGHKGNADTGSVFDTLHGMDITEIDGFDDLHHPEGVLKTLQAKATEAFGAGKSFYLTGGSTAGILTAVSATLSFGGELLVARNCHKSVYHAAFLRQLTTRYVMPEFDEDRQIMEPVTVQQVRAGLERYPYVGAVLITSPTYEGLTADVKEIAAAVHEKNIPLIVDGAHGAHFGFAAGLPRNGNEWADIVVQSLHKTTKALTQTAILHVNTDRIDVALIQRYLDIYMTSSPSYLLMASMEEAIADLQENGERLYQDFGVRISDFFKKTEKIKTLGVYKGDDPCKLLICSKVREFSGKMLYDMLRREYHLQMELCENNHVLAIMTPYDRQEGFDRLAAALNEIDRFLLDQMEKGGYSRTVRGESFTPRLPEQNKILAHSWGGGVFCPLEECAGKISVEFVYQYPPGIPLIVPGEVWDEDLLRRAKEKKASGCEILGIIEKCGTIGAMVSEDG
ncbi:MAG: hypothetical protein LUE87_03070 [Lachnospiraceae bacterium]|nr:hypothetical protein [Lachnospiraceae bacterium]